MMNLLTLCGSALLSTITFAAQPGVVTTEGSTRSTTMQSALPSTPKNAVINGILTLGEALESLGKESRWNGATNIDSNYQLGKMTATKILLHTLGDKLDKLSTSSVTIPSTARQHLKVLTTSLRLASSERFTRTDEFGTAIRNMGIGLRSRIELEKKSEAASNSLWNRISNSLSPSKNVEDIDSDWIIEKLGKAMTQSIFALHISESAEPGQLLKKTGSKATLNRESEFWNGVEAAINDYLETTGKLKYRLEKEIQNRSRAAAFIEESRKVSKLFSSNPIIGPIDLSASKEEIVLIEIPGPRSIQENLSLLNWVSSPSNHCQNLLR